MEDGLVSAGLQLMLVGMGTVLLFLTALIGAMSLMSNVVARLTPDTRGAEIEAEEIAAITAAIARYRQEHRNT